MKRGFTPVEVMIVLAIVGLMVAIALGRGYSVSDGVRKGSITKFSIKGIFWKSYEGQLVMGGLISGSEGRSSANVWDFSIRNDNPDKAKLAEALTEALEKDAPVALKYHQAFWVWPWIAGTTYNIIQVTPLTGKEK